MNRISIFSRPRALIAGAALACVAAAPMTQAQEKFPSKPIQVVIHSKYGGGTDTTARMMMIRTRRELKTDMAVGNIVGSNICNILLVGGAAALIKPLAVARTTDEGQLDLRVHPALVPRGSVLASISGALNAVYVEGEMLGPCLTSGLGAGALPTAMSVVSDIVDVGRNLLVGAQGRVPSRAFQGEHLSEKKLMDPGDQRCRWYLRFSVRDRPGILARIAGVLGAFDVSIEQMVQEGIGEGDTPVSVVMLTHESRERDVSRALKEIESLHDVVEPPRALRIEDD